MEKISFDEIDVYKVNLNLSEDDLNNLKFIVKQNNKLTIKPAHESSETQYQMRFTSIRLEKVLDSIKNHLYKLTNTSTDDCTHLIMWNYITDKHERETYFHVHNRDNQNGYMVPNPTHTFCLYLELPNNDQGAIWFKNKAGEQNKILPQVGDLLIFPASAEHMPELAPNSTNQRIVLAGNFINTKENFYNETNTQTI